MGFFYHFKAEIAAWQMGLLPFYSPSLRRAVLLPFYVKSAELLHYPHPMISYPAPTTTHPTRRRGLRAWPLPVSYPVPRAVC